MAAGGRQTHPQKVKSDQTHPEIDMLDMSSPGWVRVVSLGGWVAGRPEKVARAARGSASPRG